jgi:small subunit ribosomal protein S18
MPIRRNTGRKPKRRRREETGPKRSRYLDGVTDIDPTNYDFLRKFMTDHGKIIPARLTGATAKQQRQIKCAIRCARNIGLLP